VLGCAHPFPGKQRRGLCESFWGRGRTESDYFPADRQVIDMATIFLPTQNLAAKNVHHFDR
jgi:hypothetical protein